MKHICLPRAICDGSTSQGPKWRLSMLGLGGGGGGWGAESCTGARERIEECANEDSRFPSWLEPSRTINCLPKISAPTPGRRATVPAAVPPLLLTACPCRSKRMRRCTNQRARLSAEGVGRVEELEAGLGVVRDLLPILEPLVLGLWKTLLFHAAQLRWLAKGHWFRDAALWHHRLDCSNQHLMRRLDTLKLKQACSSN